jgi:hypothetical protein
MKVSIDTRYDTLEEALAVVALAFEASAKREPGKPKRTGKQAASGRKPSRKTAAPAESTATETATDAVSPNETNGSRRRTATQKRTTRKAAASKASATRRVSKSANADESVKTKRVSAKKATPRQAQPQKPANVAPPGQSEAIRAWARSQGMQVADAGRLSAAVIAAYQAQHD